MTTLQSIQDSTKKQDSFIVSKIFSNELPSIYAVFPK